MQRLKQNSGTSTTAGTDLANESCLNTKVNQSTDKNFFTSPTNNLNELTDSIGIQPSPVDFHRGKSTNVGPQGSGS